MLTKVKTGDLLKIKTGPHSRRIMISDLQSDVKKSRKILEPESIVLILEDSSVSDLNKNFFSSVFSTVMRYSGTKICYKDDVGYIVLHSEDEVVSEA